MQSLIFNATSLVNWYAPPNGIIRANAELVLKLLHAQVTIRFVRFCQDQLSFVNVDLEMIIDSLKRILCIERSLLQEYTAQLRFFDDFNRLGGSSSDIFMTMGFDWDQVPPGELYKLKESGLTLVTFCYDLIPILVPEYCLARVSQLFPVYISELAWSSDLIFCISQSTLIDLKDVLEKMGCPAPLTRVVVLGSDYAVKKDRDIGGSRCQQNQLPKSDYILSISTVESRKNYILLVKAYKELLNQGIDPPLLLIVGSEGWDNAYTEITLMIRENPRLSQYIIFKSGLDDSTVMYLIANSLFVVFPSHYEGWGLPVAEAMSLGKFVICSDNSSLPEVSQGLAHLLPSTNCNSWTEALKFYLSNPSKIIEREGFIRMNYKPRTWQEFTEEVVTHISILHQRK